MHTSIVDITISTLHNKVGDQTSDYQNPHQSFYTKGFIDFHLSSNLYCGTR